MVVLQELINTFLPEISEVRLVNISEEDIPFLEQVYIHTRWEELAPVDFWSDTQKRDFLISQFHAQKKHYDTHYQGGRFCVIRINDIPAGRLYLYAMASELRIVDIALLPQFRGSGYGSGILKQLINLSERAEADLTIHVEINNPAMNFYQRLGFIAEGQPNGLYRFMRRKH
ncbi:MAG: GNAT family N-acetyltransferase [Saprospiraceae bacterium]|jgi:ribosomal protein S18 acetylase RimI-like enzyme|nr:GNAT family N-acetyltransferase [Saprospiraceae bacterium]